MTATVATPPPTSATSTSTGLPADVPAGRAHERAAGAFYLLTFASSIPALLLLAPVLDNPDYVTGAGQDARVLWGCLLDVVNALAGIGSAVAIYPVAKRAGQSLALGFVLTRMVEAAVILVGVIALVTVVGLRRENVGVTGTEAVALTATAQALVSARNWTFLFGPDVMPVFNAAMFAGLLYRSRLVPRWIPAIGLAGAPLLLVSSTLTVFGHNTMSSQGAKLAALPIAVWELSIGFYLIFKGFRTARRAPRAA